MDFIRESECAVNFQTRTSNIYMQWFKELANSSYLAWLELAELQLFASQINLEEAGDIVHEAIIEFLDAIQNGSIFESRDEIQAYIEKAINFHCGHMMFGHYLAVA